MERQRSYHTLKTMTQSPNEAEGVKKINVLEFDTTQKNVFIRKVLSKDALDNVYGKLQSPYKDIYGKYL